ncbi:hypothetical protein CLG96_00670 [Sphingomonas oleivorans]|uniref:SHSP domain-containing protein n=1 Tax=Sphingomonas oleivorans TaxID=1735121 RepID=A0A2T5G0R8_9SPHN|nr:Hsp20/alpha crystallin family protein [Sphingomonas oleivorans]PTQ12710.1 hypothetical protein CLG96_00670 [Sphingomonas oleivorans]
MAMRDLIPWGRESSRTPSLYGGEEANPLLSLHREMNRLFNDAFRGFDPFRGFDMPALMPALGQRMGGGWPMVETSQTDNEVRITAELPGMREKDVEILVEDGVLTLRGERKSETEDKDRGYSERYYGRFERRIGLPAGVQEDQARATFEDGVLTITLPRSAEAIERGRRIPISRGDEATKH